LLQTGVIILKLNFGLKFNHNTFKIEFPSLFCSTITDEKAWVLFVEIYKKTVDYGIKKSCSYWFGCAYSNRK